MHKRLSECNTKAELEEEMLLSSKEVELKLGIKISHFAFTFGDIDSFSKEALLLASSQFRFCLFWLKRAIIINHTFSFNGNSKRCCS